MSKITSLIIGVVLIVLVGGFVYWQKQEAREEQMTQAAVQNAENQQPAAEQGSYAASTVAQHADRSSCWSSINGSVYDLTSWIPKHPGGEQAILQLCGTDGSAKFNRQHGGASLQQQILAGFKIGALSGAPSTGQPSVQQGEIEEEIED